MSPSHTHTSQCYREVKFKRPTSVAYKKWLSQAISAPQKSRFLSSLSPQLAGSPACSGEPLQAAALGSSSSPSCLHSNTQEDFSESTLFPSVIGKQECLWLCLAKVSAGGIVKSRQPGFVADKHEELYWLANVYPSYSNFYSEQNEAANLSSLSFLQRFVIGLEMPQEELSLD